jgi:tetratricopeptide (TPR) repeat protein
VRYLAFIAALALLTAPLLTGIGYAENKDVAREAFHEGTLQYDLSDFKSALANFKKAYLNYEDPAFLFNIAQCQRQLGDKAEALRTYRVFLSKVPNSSQRASVEKIVADLQAAIDRPPTATISPEAAQPPPRSEPVAETSASSTPSLAATAPRREKPVTKNVWFWGVVAGGAVVVAGAVTLGVVLGTRHNPIELTY